MNGRAIFGDQLWRNRWFVPRTIDDLGSEGAAVMDAIYFLLAVAATSTVIFALMMRADRINRRRGSSDGGSSTPQSTIARLQAGSGPTAAAGAMGDSVDSTKRLGAEAEIRPRFCWAFLISRKWRTIDLLPDAREYPGVVWNHLKTRLFPLHRRARSNIRLERFTEGVLP
jgi:hypothetical protein